MTDKLTDAVAFMEKAAVMLGLGGMPFPGTPYAAEWYLAHATVLAEIHRLRGERDEAVAHAKRLADWIEHEVGAELPYAEGEVDARAFLSSISTEAGE